MNEQRINQIKKNLRDLMQQILAVGEEPPPEIQDLLLQVIEKSQREIDQLRQQANEPPGGGDIAIHPDLQLLWILAGQQEQAFISYLRTYPTAATQALLNDPIQLSHTIELLSQRMPTGQQPVIDGIQHGDLNSSNIWGTAYDPKTGKMKVRFQGGSEYEYDGVPANIYRAFTKGNASAKTKGKNQYGEWWVGKNPSLGAAMNQYIKAGDFPYRKIK
jgi:hypothetical protein